MSVMLGGLGAAAAGATALAGWYVAPFLARRRAEARLRSLCTGRRTLVLTYDDGPGPALTPLVLDALATHSARATFFVLGERALAAPLLLDRMAAEGHEIGSHSLRHLNAWTSAPFRAARDADASYAALSRWMAPTAVFRPPFGKLTADVWWGARRHGRPLGWWTHVSGDTFDPLPSVDPVCDRVQRDGGGVVLLHDFDRDRSEAAERTRFVLDATTRLLDIARRDGLHVRTLSDLLAEPAA